MTGVLRIGIQCTGTIRLDGRTAICRNVRVLCFLCVSDEESSAGYPLRLPKKTDTKISLSYFFAVVVFSPMEILIPRL